MDVTLESANVLMETHFPGLIGLTFTEVAPGRSVCKVTVSPKMHNPGGILHGSVPFTLADTGMAIALLPLLEEGQRFSTLEIKISYFKPVSAGDVFCTTVISQRGKRIIFLESEITDGTRIIAKATGTYYIS